MGRDALLAALRGRSRPAGIRVPWLPYAGVYCAARAGMSPEAFCTDAEAVARGTAEVAERFAADGIPLFAEIPCELLALGGEVRWVPDAPPDPVAPPLAHWRDGDALPPVPGAGDGPYPVVFRAARALRERLAGGAAIVGMVTGPATLAYQLRGLRIYGDMVARPAAAHALFAYAGAVAARAADLLVAAGCDVVALVDTAATMLKPEVFVEFVTPNLQPALQAIHSHQVLSSLWG